MSTRDLGHLIVDTVAQQVQVPVAEIMSARTPRALRARRIAYHAMREREMTYPEIGGVFGRDHSTIMEACKNASDKEIELSKQVSWAVKGDVYFLRLATTPAGTVEVAVADPHNGQRMVLEAALAEELMRAVFRTEIRVVGLQ